MNRALLQQALVASEKMRSGLIQMRKEAESYGEAWAAAYVNEYRDLLPGSAEEQFKLLNAMQRRLSDYADAVTEGYDAIQALRTELAKPEPVPETWRSWHDTYGVGYWDTFDEAELSCAEDAVPEALFTKEQL